MVESFLDLSVSVGHTTDGLDWVIILVSFKQPKLLAMFIELSGVHSRLFSGYHSIMLFSATNVALLIECTGD